MTHQAIINALPYTAPFHFVDGLDEVTEDGVQGHYRFRQDEYFYAGHFAGKPVTPGVIITEVMAQIGLVCLGIHLAAPQAAAGARAEVAFTAADVEFLQAVLPGEKITVKSEKKYWRLGKLKCTCTAYNKDGKIVARGQLSGILKMR